MCWLVYNLMYSIMVVLLFVSIKVFNDLVIVNVNQKINVCFTLYIVDFNNEFVNY